MNYKGDPLYAKALWKCKNVETRIQKAICYGVLLRENLDLESDKDLCKYLEKVIQQRCQENKN